LLAALLTGSAAYGVPAAHACPPQDLNPNNCSPSDMKGTNGVSVAGTGTIAPGLPCPASGCAIHLDFTALFIPAGTASCTFDGTDTFPGGATVAAGSGSGTINCSGGVSASGTVTFSRTGTLVSVGGNLTANGHGCTVNADLAFAPTSPPPTTSFLVTGGGTVTCS
jgi:hypothetical protein